jgi:hypothetical protein
MSDDTYLDGENACPAGFPVHNPVTPGLAHESPAERARDFRAPGAFPRPRGDEEYRIRHCRDITS